VTSPGPDGDRVAFGFLLRDGRPAGLVGGERRIERDRQGGWISRITLEARDAEGRDLVATGVPVSRMVINRHTFIDVTSLIRWDLNGAPGWGEDQDMWPVHRWARARREAAR
jgi:hypothetical protein